MAETIVKKRPIDAFIEYFNDVKPYHAKILEVVEKYNFYDDINVSFEETIFNKLNITTKALCKGVGFGLEWDDPECGYDAIECCTLGTCPTDDTIFENLTDVITTPIASINPAEGKITVQGNYSYDMTFQIKRILTKDSFTISGDITTLLDDQPMFVIVAYDTIDYIFNSVNSIKLSGNYSQQFIDKRIFTIYGSKRNDGEYHVVSANYAPATNITTIIVSETMFINDFGKILIASKTTNNGFYNVVSANFNGADTTVFIDNTNRNLIIEEKPTSIIMKTGFLQKRIINLTGNPNNDDYVIVDSKYNYINDTTDIYIINQLQSNSNTGTATLRINTNADAYVNDINCKPPKENNLSINFAEQLHIIVTNVSASSSSVESTAIVENNEGWFATFQLLNSSVCANAVPSMIDITNITVDWNYYSQLDDPSSIATQDVDTCMLSYNPDNLVGLCGGLISINSGSMTFDSFSRSHDNVWTAPITGTLYDTLNGLNFGQCGEAVIMKFNITTDDGVTQPETYVYAQPGT